MCIIDLSRLIQRIGKSNDTFIARFKLAKNKYKVYLLENEYVKMA